MKNILLIIMSITLLSCASTPKIYYQEDVFYPQNSRYETDWVNYNLGNGSIKIRFIKRSDKIFVQGRYTRDRSFYVEKNDKISLKFSDGTTIHLDYDGYISEPTSYSFNYFDMPTKIKEVTEWGTLEYIRAESNLGYRNIETKQLSDYAEKVLNVYNRLKNNEYDEKETKD